LCSSNKCIKGRLKDERKRVERDREKGGNREREVRLG
jgi:hypothetical protein